MKTALSRVPALCFAAMLSVGSLAQSAFAQAVTITPPVDMGAVTTAASAAYGDYMQPVILLAIGIVVVMTVAGLIFWALRRK